MAVCCSMRVKARTANSTGSSIGAVDHPLMKSQRRWFRFRRFLLVCVFCLSLICMLIIISAPSKSSWLDSLFVSYTLPLDPPFFLVMFGMQAFREMNMQPSELFVVGPAKYKVWLEEYSEVQDICLERITFIESLEIVCPVFKSPPESLQRYTNHFIIQQLFESKSCLLTIHRLLQSTGLTSFETVDVDHCPNAFALVMTHQTGWKLVFSGDGRPSNSLV
jgi:hypothetical protein